MTLREMLERLDLSGETAGETADETRAIRLLVGLPDSAPADWRALAVALALRCQARCTRVLGISGGQGAGKTTLARLVAAALEALGLRSLCLSIDDFYLTRAQRRNLGASVHPLLATRGVPGTHDVALAVNVIEALLAGERTAVPGFDKSKDDRSVRVQIESAVDVVIFEGWCLGANAQAAAALVDPCNELERVEDADGRWRRHVNERLRQDYPALWRLIDDLLFLAVPDLAAVRRWRAAQEAELIRDPGDPAAMNAAQLDHFIAHYERLTRWMLEDLPGRADMTGWLDDQHRLRDLTVRGRGRPGSQAR